jgi:hypothetical protein
MYLLFVFHFSKLLIILKLLQPPASFLVTMEEYVTEAPTVAQKDKVREMLKLADV